MCQHGPIMPRFLLAAVLLGGLLGCASAPPTDAPATAPPPASDARPTCNEIAKTCHSHDDHGGLPRECHQLGHNPRSTNDQCEARKAECMAACKEGHAH